MSVDGGLARIVRSWLPCPCANADDCVEDEPVAALVAEPARERPRERLPDARREAAGEGGAMRVGVKGDELEGSVGVCAEEVDWRAEGEAEEVITAGGSSGGSEADEGDGAPGVVSMARALWGGPAITGWPALSAPAE